MPFLLFAAGLWVVSALLISTHLVAWRKVRDREVDDRDREFAWRQFRRRIQASSMLAIVGLGIVLGGWVRPREQPALFVTIWAVVAVIVLWMVLLAAADALATRAHLMSSIRRERHEAARFSTEMYRRGRQGGNGQTDQG